MAIGIKGILVLLDSYTNSLMEEQFNKTIISKATIEDAKILTDITKKSKAHWGYSNEQMESWSSQLTIATNYIEINEVYKLVMNDLVAEGGRAKPQPIARGQAFGCVTIEKNFIKSVVVASN